MKEFVSEQNIEEVGYLAYTAIMLQKYLPLEEFTIQKVDTSRGSEGLKTHFGYQVLVDRRPGNAGNFLMHIPGEGDKDDRIVIHAREAIWRVDDAEEGWKIIKREDHTSSQKVVEMVRMFVFLVASDNERLSILEATKA